MAKWSSKFLLSVFIKAISIQKTNAVTCFGFGGLAYPDNIICPGSNACCGSTATCLSNRLCHNAGDNNSTFVRGPCAISPYNVETCAAVCLYNETTGFLPRVTVCDNGSYCCNGFPNCCETGEGVFLDSTGDIVSHLPSAATPSTSLLSSISSSLSQPGSSSSPSSSTFQTGTLTAVKTSTPPPASTTTSHTPPSSPSSNLSTGVKVAVGVTTSLGFVVVSGLLITIWFQRKQIRRAKVGASQGQGLPPYTDRRESPIHPWVMEPIEMATKDRLVVTELPTHNTYEK